MEKKSITVKVTGTVQRVGYRYFVLHAAKELGIKGYVKNKPDDSVYIEAEGDVDSMNFFLHKCKEGPPRAQVIGFEINSKEQKNYDDFVIR